MSCLLPDAFSSQWMETNSRKFSSRRSEFVKCKHLPHHRIKWSNNPGQVPLCTWHQTGAQWETGDLSFARDPLRPWETPTLRSADKCCRCPSCLLFSLGRLGDSHASTQCLNKRVYLIQLSPQGRAKWVPVLFDRDNERAERWGEGRSLVGCFGGEEGDLSSFRRSYFSFPYMLLWTLMCLWCLASFSIEWHILQSTIITVQISPNGDMERVKYKEDGHWMQLLGIFPNLAAIPLQWRVCHTMQNTEEPPLFDLQSLYTVGP